MVVAVHKGYRARKGGREGFTQGGAWSPPMEGEGARTDSSNHVWCWAKRSKRLQAPAEGALCGGRWARREQGVCVLLRLLISGGKGGLSLLCTKERGQRANMVCLSCPRGPALIGCFRLEEGGGRLGALASAAANEGAAGLPAGGLR